jgi:hypothetical protein
MTRTLSLAFLLAVAACGGKDKGSATTTTTTEQHGEHGSGHAGEHHDLTPELKGFHDILSPLWHAPQGAQRITDTCAAIEKLTMAADAVGKATPPVSTNADTWTAGTRALVTDVAGLEKECTAKDPGRFEAAFTKVHDDFHVLMEQAKPAA